MQLHMLLTSELPDMPAGIRVLQDWGDVSIVVGRDIKNIVSGKHIAVECHIEDFKHWLGGHEAWIGVGSVMLQRFVKELVIAPTTESTVSTR